MPRKKLPTKQIITVEKKPPTNWVVCGFDVSLSVIAGAGIGWDGVLGKMVGPVFAEQRFQSSVDYFERLRHAAKAHVVVQELIAKLVMTPQLDEIHVYYEEPWPVGMAKRGDSQWLKQQAMMVGSFAGGLVRYGYVNLVEVNNQLWKSPIGKEIGMSTRDPNFKTDGMKSWALQAYKGVPDRPHMIRKSGVGLIPKPETSKAKPVQADDIYDALGIMTYGQNEVEDAFDEM